MELYTSSHTGAAIDAAITAVSSKAASGANSDITSLSGLTTALSVAQGGTGQTTLTTNSYIKGNGTGAVTLRTYAQVKTDLSLNNVENTALSTWAGTSNITTLGTVTSGNTDAVVSRNLSFSLYDSDTSVAVGDGKASSTIPLELNGMNLTNVIASVHTKGITGTTDIQVRRRRAGSDVDMLTDKITIGDEYFASDETVNTSNDDVNTGDQIYIDVDAIHSGTAPLGLSVTLTFSN